MQNHLISKQIKAARNLLGISQDELVKLTALSKTTIARAESMSDKVTVRPSTIKFIQNTLEQQGISFIDSTESSNKLGIILNLDSLP